MNTTTYTHNTRDRDRDSDIAQLKHDLYWGATSQDSELQYWDKTDSDQYDFVRRGLNHYQKIRHKRSRVPNRTPQTTDLDFGELGVNTYDGRLYLRVVHAPDSEYNLFIDSDNARKPQYDSDVIIEVGKPFITAVKPEDLGYIPREADTWWDIPNGVLYLYNEKGEWEAISTRRNSTPPPNALIGDTWYNPDEDVLYLFNQHEEWEQISTPRDSEAPTNPIAGDTWYDEMTNILRVYDGEKWKSAGGAEVSDTPPNPPNNEGDLWYNTRNDTLYAYDADDDRWKSLSTTRDSDAPTELNSGVPLNPGDSWWDEQEKKLKVWNGNEWVGAGGDFDIFDTNGVIQSTVPNDLQGKTIRGFDAFNTPDFPGAFYSGLTVIGPETTHNGQLAWNWNNEPSVYDLDNRSSHPGLYWRVSESGSQWGDWEEIASMSKVNEIAENLTVTGNPYPDPVPYDLTGFYSGNFPEDEIVVALVSTRAMTVDSRFVDSYSYLFTAPTQQQVFKIILNGTQVSTITFEAGSRLGIFASMTGDLKISAGDLLEIVVPDGEPDNVMASMTVSIKGSISPLDFRAYDHYAFVQGNPEPEEILLAEVAVRQFTIPADCAGSYAVCKVPPTDDVTFNIRKGWPVGAIVGDLRFAAGSTTGVFRTVGPGGAPGEGAPLSLGFNVQDVLSISSPEPGENFGIEDIAINIKSEITNT